MNSCSSFSGQGGVQRVHLIDGTLGGALLLELFSRDGVGTMVARCVVIFPSPNNGTVFIVSIIRYFYCLILLL